MGNKNNSKTKNNKYNKKNININKNNEIITPINKNKTNHQTMRLKNNTKTNDDNKKKRNLINDQNSKPVKHETEAKLISSKYILNCENASVLRVLPTTTSPREPLRICVR